MTTHRELMDTALKGTFVPTLRQNGFAGTFPHFRRKLEGRIDFLDIQFAREGGRFCINIGQTGPNGLQDPAWPDLTIERTDVGHLLIRSRVHHGWFMKQWFDFAPRSYDPRKPAQPASHYDAIALRAVQAFEKDGEAWFNKPRKL